MGQNDTIGKIELNPSFVLSSDETNYKNDIQLFHQLFDEQPGNMKPRDPWSPLCTPAASKQLRRLYNRDLLLPFNPFVSLVPVTGTNQVYLHHVASMCFSVLPLRTSQG